MKKVLTRFIRLCFFSLMLMPAVVLLSYALLSDWQIGVCVFLAAMALGAIATFLPAYVGNYRVETVVDPASLRHSSTLSMYYERPVTVQKRHGFRLPVRWIACLILLAGVVAFGVLVPFSGVPWYQRGGFCLAVAIPVALLLRELPKPDLHFLGVGAITVGGLLYAGAGVALWVMRNMQVEAVDSLNSVILICMALYIVLSVYLLNENSMDSGFHANSRAKLPSRMTKANRLLVSLFVIAVLLVTFSSQIRAFFESLWGGVRGLIARLVAWLMSLFPAAEESPVTSVPESSGEMMLLPAGDTEPAMVWVVLEKVFIVVAAIIAVAAVGFLLFKLYKALRVLIRKIAAAIQKYSRAVGEDYVDEQETLFDWDDVRKEVGESLRARWKKWFEREKRYEQLDPRERVRYIARELYRRDGGNHATQTFREAARSLDFRSANVEDACELYERTRYSDKPVKQEEPDSLKKAVKL